MQLYIQPKGWSSPEPKLKFSPFRLHATITRRYEGSGLLTKVIGLVVYVPLPKFRAIVFGIYRDAKPQLIAFGPQRHAVWEYGDNAGLPLFDYAETL